MKLGNFTLSAMVVALALTTSTSFAEDTATPATTTTPTASGDVQNKDAANTTDATDRSPASRRHKKKRAKHGAKKHRRKHRSAMNTLESAPMAGGDKVARVSAANDKVAQEESEISPNANRASNEPGESTPAAAASTSSGRSKLSDKISMAYIGWMTGPHYDGLDGGQNSAPSNINIDHFLSFGFKFNPDVKLAVTEDVTQNIGRAYDAPGQQQAIVHNPYVTLSNAHMLENKARGLNLATYIRYYVPVANADRQGNHAPGAQQDQTAGVFRAKVDPSLTLMDGALTISGMTFLYRAIPGSDPAPETINQRDWYVYMYPGIQYQATKTVAPYVRYSNVMEHYGKEKASNGGGHWTRFSENHNLEFGFDWTPSSSVTVTPYTEFGAPGSGLDKPWKFSQNTLGLIAEWDFI